MLIFYSYIVKNDFFTDGRRFLRFSLFSSRIYFFFLRQPLLFGIFYISFIISYVCIIGIFRLMPSLWVVKCWIWLKKLLTWCTLSLGLRETVSYDSKLRRCHYCYQTTSLTFLVSFQYNCCSFHIYVCIYFIKIFHDNSN